jgi:RNA polymerase sigma-70 factor (sigma-E family)
MRSTERDAEFTEFVAAQRPGLVRTARLLTAGDQASAEDIVQTTLTRLYVRWGRVRRTGNPVGYARTTLTHCFIDESRRAHRRRESLTDAPARDDGRADSPDHELRAHVLTALRDLAPRQRAVVVLRHWLDQDVQETARILGCSVGTVKSQNARALAHLRAALEPTIQLEEIS